MIILDGKETARKKREELRDKISRISKSPKLSVILVGDNPASKIYVRNKQRAAEKVGIKAEILSTYIIFFIAEILFGTEPP